MSIDYLWNNYLRFSINYLLDEFVIDKNIEKNKDHGKAYSVRIASSPNRSKNYILTKYITYVKVGTYTFRHGMGTNNLVHQGKPLGWYNGSDGHELKIGLNFFNRKNLIFSASCGILETGDENLIYRVFDSYANLEKGKFPSGEVEKKSFINSSIQWYLKNHICLIFTGRVEKVNNNSFINKWFIIGIDYFVPLTIDL